MRPRPRGLTRNLFVVSALLYVATRVTNRSLRRVEGPSMEPTLSAGELVLVLPAQLVTLRRGDIVVVPDPREPRRRTIKRVAALAGEVVGVDGRELRAGADQLVVLGDAPSASTDSRAFGPVAATDVLAVAVARLRPFRWLRGGTVRPTPRPG